MWAGESYEGGSPYDPWSSDWEQGYSGGGSGYIDSGGYNADGSKSY